MIDMGEIIKILGHAIVDVVVYLAENMDDDDE